MLFARVLAVVTGLYLLTVAWITLNPFPADPHENGLLEGLLAAFATTPLLRWIDYDVVEFTANILMFVPFGVLFTLRLGVWRWWLVLAMGAATTLTIEFVQLFMPERVSDPRDLLANTLGAALGIVIVVAGTVISGRIGRRRARTVAPVADVLTAAARP